MGNIDQDQSDLGAAEVVSLGAIGGLVIGIATYPTMEMGYADLLVRPDIAEWIGFLLRIVGTTLLGALWGWINRPETDRKRAFQVGLAAPATVMGMVYANGITAAVPTTSTLPPRSEISIEAPARAASEFRLIATAHAADGLFSVPILPLAGPDDKKQGTFIDRVIKGVLGR